MTYTTVGICPNSTTFDVSIVTIGDPSFTYAAASFCQGDVDPLPTVTGTPGGTYTATAGLSINLSTGEIDLSASTVGGPYTVTYTTPGSCNSSTTFDVSVDPEDDPSFTYPAASYCQDDADPTPTITGTAGGTFTSTAGLSIVGGTGVIDLSASTGGATYTITYTTVGTCPNSTTFDVTIELEENPAFTYAAASFCQGDADPSPTVTGTIGGTFTAPAAVSINASTGVIDLSASTVGAGYVITYTTPGTCSNATTFTVDVVAEDDPSFSYASASYCQGGADPTPTITGTVGGTFTAPAALSINAATGEIDVSASTAGGPYVVTYTTAGTCPNATTFNVTIILDDPSFTYAAAAFCQGDADPSPTITGTPGGSFSAPAAVSINASTGVIDLSASTVGGPYTITYTTSGACPIGATFDISIDAEDDPAFTYPAASYCQGDADPTPTITGTIGGTFTSTAGLSIIAGTGVIDVSASTTGATYTVTYTTGGICPNSTTFDVTIEAEEDPAFTYAAASFCQGDADPLPTITGTAGGTFTAPAAVSINASTGEIDLSASTVGGAYTITYTTPGTCSNSTTFDVTIDPEDDPAFTYTAASYCISDPNPTPTITGNAGGTFTSTAGLVINAGTGEVDLATSAIGAYTVTYATGGICPNSTTFNIAIVTTGDPSFTYTANNYCQSDANPLPTVTGGPGGTYSATTGLVINLSTGEIDLAASSIGGPYIVTYTTPGSCNSSTTFNIDVLPEDNPSFTYPAATYCKDDANPTPTIMGTAGGTFTSTAGLIINAGTGVIDLSASTSGATYTVTYTTGGTCPNSTTYNVSIVLDDPSFTYASTNYCQGAADPAPIITGDPGGAFSAPAAISINLSTGVIDLSASTAGGPYTITYTAPGGCANSATFEVTIDPEDDPSFTYVAPSYCQGGADPTPVITGISGGIFTATAGLIINAGTGVIDASASTAGGPYVVTYTTGGTCPNATTFNVTIILDDPSFTYAAAAFCQGDADPSPTITGTASGSFSAPAAVSINASTGVIDLSTSAVGGPYTIAYTTSGSCPIGATFDLTINPEDDPAFTYGAASYCLTDLNPTPTVSGAAGGIFTATAGLSIDAGSGEINVATSTVGGPYIVTYSTSGLCPNNTTFNITIVTDDDPSFAYSSNTYCQGDINPVPIVTGAAGGTFTAPAGVVLNGSTGEINLISSTLGGPYTITYTTAGSCSSATTFDITIDSEDDPSFIFDVSTYCQSESNPIPSLTGLSGGTFSAPGGVSINAGTGEINLSASTVGGPYAITYTTTGICPNTASFNISILDSLNVDAGLDDIVCFHAANVNLNGTVPISGIWSTSGTGSFSPNNSLMTASYIPTIADSTAGQVTLTLTSTNNGGCAAAIDSIIVTINPGIYVDAGSSQTVCADTAGIDLTGTIIGATGGQWSTNGGGSFSPNNSLLTASYLPTASDTIFDSVMVVLSSTGNGGCIAVTDTIFIIMTAPPVSNAGLDLSACATNPVFNLSGTISGGSSSGIWTTDGDGAFSIPTTDLNAIYTAGDTDTTAGSVNLYLTSTLNGMCQAIVDTVELSFSNGVIVDPGIDLTVCENNDTINLNGIITGATSTGSWSTSGSGDFNPNNSLLTASYNSSAADHNSGSVYLTLSSTNNGGCLLEKDSILITYTPMPAVDAGLDENICANNPSIILSGTVSGGSTSGRWFSLGSGSFFPNDTTFNATYTASPTDIAVGFVDLFLVSTNNGICLPIADTVRLNITQPPLINTGIAPSICNDDSLQLNGMINSGSNTAIWSSLGTGSFNPISTDLNAYYVPGSADTLAGTVQLVLTSTNNLGCLAVDDTLVVNFTPRPLVAIDSLDGSVCGNNADINIYGNISGSSTTGIWTSSGTGSFTPNDSSLTATYIPSIADIAAGSVLITLTSTNSCASTDTATAYFTPAPQVNANVDQFICFGDMDAVLDGSVSGITTEGVWSSSGSGTFAPNNSILNATYNLSTADSIAGGFDLILTSINNGTCSENTDTLTITITGVPIIDAGIPDTSCSNALVSLSGNVSGGPTTGGWETLGDGNFTPDTSDLNAQYQFGAGDISAGNVNIVLHSTLACASISDTLELVVTPGPISNAGNDTTVCSNNVNINLNGIISGITTTGIWTSSGTGIFSPNPSALNASYIPSAADILQDSISLILSTTNNGECNSDLDSLKIYLSSPPTVNAGNNIAVCVGDTSASLVGFVSGATTTGIWTTLGSGYFSPNDSTLNGLYVLSPDDIAANGTSIILTSTNNGVCNSNDDTLAITITTAPLVNAGFDNSACANTQVVLIGSISGGTTTGVWTTLGNGTFSDSSSMNPIYSFGTSETATGSVNLILTSTDACIDKSDTVNYLVSKPPVSIAGSNQVVCYNNPAISLIGEITGASSTGLWTSSGSGIFIPNNSSLIVNYVPSVPDKNNGSVILTLTSTNNGDCNPNADAMLVTITPPPLVEAGINELICTTDNISLLGSVSGGSASGEWTSSGSGTFLPSNTVLNPTYVPSPADTTNGFVNIALTSTNNGTCNTVSDTLLITIVPTPFVNAGNDETACGNNGIVNLFGTVSGSAISGEWSTLGTGNFSPSDTLLTTNYIPSQTDQNSGFVQLILNSTNSCNKADTVYINYTPSPVVDAGPDVFVCISNPNVALNGSVSGGSTTGTWTTSGTGSFSPNNTTLTATYIPSPADTIAGLVEITLTSTNNGSCNPEEDTIYIHIVDNPTVSAGNNQTVCANVPIQLGGTITGASEGLWESLGTGYFVPDATDFNATYVISSDDSLAGNVTLTFTPTNFSGCVADIDTMITTITPAPYANGGPDISICANNDTAYLVGQIFGPTSTGIWSTFGSGFFTENETILNNVYIPSAADKMAGFVVLALTTTNNGICSEETYLVLITITPAPTVDVGTDLVVCNDDVIPLNAIIGGGSIGVIWSSSGTGSFLPNNSDLNATYIPSGMDTTVANIIISAQTIDSTFCIDVSDSIVVQFTSRPVVIAGPNDTVCSNNSDVFLSGNVSGSTATGIWSTSGTGIFTPSNTALNATYKPSSQDSLAGFATLTLSSTNACLEQDSLLVVITPAPLVDAGIDQILCEGDTTAVLAGNVSLGSTVGVWTTLGTGYFLPNDSALNATYVLSSADTIAHAVTLVLESIDNGNCFPENDTLEIIITSIPLIIAGLNDTTCSNVPLPLNGSIIGGSGQTEWTSLNGGYFTDSSLVNTNFINPPGAGSYQLVLSSVNACIEASDTIDIEVTPAPELTISVVSPVCIENILIDLEGTVNNASGANWNSIGTGMFSDETSLSTQYFGDANDSTAGIVTVALTSTGNGTCNAVTVSTDILFNPYPNPDAGANITICTVNGINVQLNGNVSTGTSTGSWSSLGTGSFFPSDTVLNSIYIPSQADTAQGFANLILTTTNNGSCPEISDTLMVNWEIPPIISILNPDTVCLGQLPVNMDVYVFGGNSSLVWQTTGTGVFSPNDSVLNASYIPSDNDISNGGVQLFIESPNCPMYFDSIDLSFFESPVADFSFNLLCNDSLVPFIDLSTISNGIISDWNWNFGTDSSLVQNPTYAFGLDTSSVQLIVTTVAGCSDTIRQSVSIQTVAAEFTFEGDCVTDLLTFVNSTAVTGDSIISYYWDFEDENTSTLIEPSHSYEVEGDYYVSLTVTTMNGCGDSVTNLVSGECPILDGVPFVPSGFTPNGDGVNDILFVDGGPFLEFEFRIYNNWGELIFQSTEQSNGWNGMKLNSDQPIGVYVYTVRAVTLNEKEYTMKGDITLVR